MTLDRRHFLGSAALGAGSFALGCGSNPGGDTSGSTSRPHSDIPAVIRALNPMTACVVPISEDERETRIANAQSLMNELKIDAILMEVTTSCFYYTGVAIDKSFG